MTYDGVKTESNNGTRKNTRRYVIICNSDYVRVNGLYNDSNKERKEAFARLEQLRKKGTVTDDDAELASYREDKYGR